METTEAVMEAPAASPGASGAEEPAAPTTPAPAVLTSLSLIASANPNIVAPGGSTEIAVFLTDNNNSPVPNAQVVVASGGGIFLTTGTTRVVGYTDQGGVFRTQWRTNAPSAYTGDMSYVIGVEANKDGVQASRGEVTIFIRMGG